MQKAAEESAAFLGGLSAISNSVAEMQNYSRLVQTAADQLVMLSLNQDAEVAQ